MARVSGSKGGGTRAAWLMTGIGLDQLRKDPCSHSEAVNGRCGVTKGRAILSRCYTNLGGVAGLVREATSMVLPWILQEAQRAQGYRTQDVRSWR